MGNNKGRLVALTMAIVGCLFLVLLSTVTLNIEVAEAQSETPGSEIFHNPTPVPTLYIDVEPTVVVTEFVPPKNNADFVFEDGPCHISTNFSWKVYRWCPLITRQAEKNNLDPNLIAALITQESGGNYMAYSHSGAVGLMQVMPRNGLAASFQCKNGPCFADRPTIKQLQDPEFNVNYGTKMLAGLVNKYGNERDALLRYGPMDVGYYYADKVLAIRDKYSHP